MNKNVIGHLLSHIRHQFNHFKSIIITLIGTVVAVANRLFVASDNAAGIFVGALGGSIAARIVDDIVESLVHGRVAVGRTSAGTARISVHLVVLLVRRGLLAAPSSGLGILAGIAAVPIPAAYAAGSTAGIAGTAVEGHPDS